MRKRKRPTEAQDDWDLNLVLRSKVRMRWKEVPLFLLYSNGPSLFLSFLAGFFRSYFTKCAPIYLQHSRSFRMVPLGSQLEDFSWALSSSLEVRHTHPPTHACMHTAIQTECAKPRSDMVSSLEFKSIRCFGLLNCFCESHTYLCKTLGNHEEEPRRPFSCSEAWSSFEIELGPISVIAFPRETQPDLPKWISLRLISINPDLPITFHQARFVHRVMDHVKWTNAQNVSKPRIQIEEGFQSECPVSPLTHILSSECFLFPNLD